MNKDKSIKDLKQYNDKLKNQFEYSKIRVCNLERENERLQQELQRKDNNWNELKNELEQEIAIVSTNRTVDYNNPEWWYKKNFYGNILDKIKELEDEK